MDGVINLKFQIFCIKILNVKISYGDFLFHFI
jgi:hypothetical protein